MFAQSHSGAFPSSLPKVPGIKTSAKGASGVDSDIIEMMGAGGGIEE